ncbi:MAG: DUF3450 family protein, partial [Gammaproteobacteria bacterium]|nr:DUF3450 family protein [Gammaproteobacteria bacterium]
MLFSPRKYLILLIPSVLSLSSVCASADTLSKTIATESAIQKSAIKSQKNIDGLDDRTRKMLEQFRSVTRQTRTLLTYNEHLQALLASQEIEK